MRCAPVIIGRGSFNCLANEHNHFPLAPTVKFAEKNSLPAAEQKLAIFERNCDTGTNYARFDVCVGVFFAMAKVHAVLRNQSAEGVQHVARHIWIGILVNGQASRRDCTASP